ncbi:MAG: peptidase inhibitor family I36 protein [Hellea sp.]
MIQTNPISKNILRTARLVALASSALAFLVLPAQAQSSSEGVTLYQHCNYGGYAVKLSDGNTNYGDLIRRGAKNDDVSSIKVSPGYSVQIFRDANYKGPSKTFDKDVSCLVSHKMNDYLSSVKVTKKATPVASSNASCENHHVGPGVSQEMVDANCAAGATHSYLTGVLHHGGDLMHSHDVNGKNVSAAYFKGGRLEETGQNSKVWKEYDKDRKAVFTFKETHRDEWSVYLNDTSRNVRLQIDVHRKVVGYASGDAKMKDLYSVLHFNEFH